MVCSSQAGCTSLAPGFVGGFSDARFPRFFIPPHDTHETRSHTAWRCSSTGSAGWPSCTGGGAGPLGPDPRRRPASRAATLSGPTSTSFSIPGTEAQEAIDTLQARFPAADAAGPSARVVFAAPEGGSLTDPANAAKVSDVLATLRRGSQGRLRERPVHHRHGQPGRTRGLRAGDVLGPLDRADRGRPRDAPGGAAAGRASGLTVEVGGDALQALPEQGASEAIGILIAAVVLFITFGSFVAAGLPLLTALMGIGIGVGLITAATGFVDLSATTSILAVMIGLAVVHRLRAVHPVPLPLRARR